MVTQYLADGLDHSLTGLHFLGDLEFPGFLDLLPTGQ